ncbi:uncharacterized protein PV09_09473 [Verruconis gallopava]|uniref:Uncharacterized protein n=1 Tax=Verruconis gallopava TaxID=253628 RepID=A0A0D1YDF8_9PEZI|nr:uncharacterized protein PV09_09473 [Verruconis gallopava]KIV98776.1 hypothetical protein PV09_09473 [Verruconis gallopava]
MYTEAKADAKSTIEAIEAIKQDVKMARDSIQKGLQMRQEAETAAQEAKTAAQEEAASAGKAAAGLAKEIKHKTPQQASIPLSYAAVAARGMLAASIHSPQNAKTPPAQTQREIIVNIRSPQTIENLRAKGPRHLKTHVEQAIAQSENELKNDHTG